MPCRVIEAIIKDIMVKYLEDNKLLSTFQYGFRKHHSTGLQILECLNDCMDLSGGIKRLC